MKIKTALVFTASLLLAVLALSACGSAEESDASDAETESDASVTDEGSDLFATMGGRDIAETNLTGEQLEGQDPSEEVQRFLTDIAGIIRGEEGYEDLHNQFVEFLSDMVENEEDNDWVITGESRVYASVVPMLGWSVEDNEVYGATIIVFTEDLQEMFAFYLAYDGSYSWAQMGDFSESKFEGLLMENPKSEYLLISDGDVGFWLGEGNEIIEQGLSTDGISISDDYYETLCGFGIGISYEKLTDEQNLVAFDF